MRAARIHMPTEVLLDLLQLPRTLSIEAHPTYSTERPRVIEFFLEGEALAEEFLVQDGEVIPDAILEYDQAYTFDGTLLTMRLVSLRRG